MTIYFTNIGSRKFAIKRLLQGALKYLGQPSRDIEMSVSIVSPEEIQRLNKEFRNVDAVTDVLSFPTFDNPTRQILSVVTCSADAINPATGKINIGDVIICLDRAKEQAVSYGHSLKRELSFLALHGMLHLLGYDHIEPYDEKQMNELQDTILNKMHLTREVK